MARGSFFEHSKKSENQFRFRYECEKCGHMTEWFPARITQMAKQFRRIGRFSAQTEMLKGADTLIKLQKKANKQVNEVVADIKAALSAESDAVQIEDLFIRQIYNEEFSAGKACPKCGEGQSWYPEASSKKNKKRKHGDSDAKTTINRPEIEWGKTQAVTDYAPETESLEVDIPTHTITTHNPASYRQLTGDPYVNLPQVVEVEDMEDGTATVTLEGFDGVTLAEKIGNGAETLAIEDYFLQLCDVLEYLSEQDPPIYHKEITAENILVGADNTLKLMTLERTTNEGSDEESIRQVGVLLRSLGAEHVEKFGDAIDLCENGCESFEDIRESISSAIHAKSAKMWKVIGIIAMVVFILRRLYLRLFKIYLP